MLVAKSPLRINFLGGGSDFPEVFSLQGGAVFGAAINLSVYLSASLIPPFASEKFRFTYRKTESVIEATEFEHPVVRHLLCENTWLPPLNLATMSDVPGNSGLGSSSSFTVSLVHLISHIKGLTLQPIDIAKEAIRVERHILKEAGGWQDQLHASNGGLSLYTFGPDGEIGIDSVLENDPVIDLLNESMLLIPVGGARDSSELSKRYRQGLGQRNFLQMIKENSELALTTSRVFKNEFLEPNDKITYLGKAMRRAWHIKVETSPNANLLEADLLISKGVASGALAGKLCGAGESGFLFFLVLPENKRKVLEGLGSSVSFSPSISIEGSSINATHEGPEISNKTWAV
jgi:D-glycero-alpha-D-manno-heptose-7-phosphate kinase